MSKCAFVTGASGFVGPYLIDELKHSDYNVYGADRVGSSDFQVDILDQSSLEAILVEIRPDYICHLAGFSSVKDSFSDPELCRRINVEGTDNLLKAVRNVNSGAKVLIVSSSHAYGNPKYLPINEFHPLSPNSPYALSRVEQEKHVLESGLNTVISRSFNHTGPRQQRGFVCPDFVAEVKDVLSGVKNSIEVGNLDVERDISDVRDVVKAYRTLLESGVCGEIYNVCFGKPVSVQYILESILNLAGLGFSSVKVDPVKFRPVDVPVMYGDNSKIAKLGWKPTYTIKETLKDMWEY